MNTLLQLGILFQALGAVQGRKKLQKLVHILQEFGTPFGVRFGYRHYGPYSEDLQDLLLGFRQDGLISEMAVDGQYPTSRFTPEPKLEQLLAKVDVEKKPAWLELAVQLNQKTPRELEAISTLIYLEKNSTHAFQSSVDEAFVELKPQLADLLEDTHQALRTLRSTYREQNTLN